MRISYSAMNRMLEERIAREPGLRKRLERQGRGVLSDGRTMSDVQLLEKLRERNVEMDRPRFDELAQQCVSAQEMSLTLLGKGHLAQKSKDDWVWIALACLWERWLPNRASLEMIDDKMQMGYELLSDGVGDSQKACRLWLEVWRETLRVMQFRQLRAFREFDDLFGGTQSLFNWVQDLELELGNAGKERTSFFKERISLCETVLEQFPKEDELLIQNFRRALAESHFELGDSGTGDRLYTEWLDDDPRWGWGWIGWSDNYFLCESGRKDLGRAERLLKQGLDQKEVRDRDAMLDRLEDLYLELGRPAQAEAVHRESQRLEKLGSVGLGTITASDGQSQPAHDGSANPGKHRVGRNKPCPCGSGRKFKKCCGGR